MRLWHKDLIDVLPDRQLLGQWRELSAIAGSIKKCGTPKHLLVDKIMAYSLGDFVIYAEKVFQEMRHRKFKATANTLCKIRSLDTKLFKNIHRGANIYADWHNDRYLNQCYYNLEEKYDCGGITQLDWNRIVDRCEEVLYGEK